MLNKKTQRWALFLLMPLSLMATIPFSQYTVHQLRSAALQQQQQWLVAHENGTAHSRLTHQLIEVMILPFAARQHSD